MGKHFWQSKLTSILKGHMWGSVGGGSSCLRLCLSCLVPKWDDQIKCYSSKLELPLLVLSLQTLPPPFSPSPKCQCLATLLHATWKPLGSKNGFKVYSWLTRFFFQEQLLSSTHLPEEWSWCMDVYFQRTNM